MEMRKNPGYNIKIFLILIKNKIPILNTFKNKKFI